MKADFRFTIKILVASFLFFAIALQAESAGRLEKKEVIFLKKGSLVSSAPNDQTFYKGNGDGETGFVYNKDRCVRGPNVLEIDGAGNLYIQDLVGQKVQIFSKGGIFTKGISDPQFGRGEMSVDEDGNIYLPGAGHMSKNGKSSKTRDRSVLLIQKTGEKKNLKKKWGPYFHQGSFYAHSGKIVSKLDEAGGAERGTFFPPVFGDGRDANYLNPDPSYGARKKVLFKMARIKEKYRKMSGKDIAQENVEFDLPQEPSPLYPVFKIVGFDEKYNFYVVVGYADMHAKTVAIKKEKLCVYSMDGKLLTETTIPVDWGGYPGDVRDRLFKVDLEGNVYQLNTEEDGVHVYKWSVK